MVAHLIQFATEHYLLVGAFAILLALLIAHELSAVAAASAPVN